MFQLKMKRQLTAEERCEVLRHLSEYPQEDIFEAIRLFEERFQTPVTVNCVNRIIVEDALKKRGI